MATNEDIMELGRAVFELLKREDDNFAKERVMSFNLFDHRRRLEIMLHDGDKVSLPIKAVIFRETF